MPGLRHVATSTPCILVGYRRACNGQITHMQPFHFIPMAMHVPQWRLKEDCALAGQMLGAHRMINRTCQDLLNQTKAADAKTHDDNVTPACTEPGSGPAAPLARGSPTSVLSATPDGALRADTAITVRVCD